MFAMAHPIQFMFGSRVWFSGSADRMALYPVHLGLHTTSPFSKWGSRRDMTWQKILTRFLLHVTLWAGKQQFIRLIQTLTRINTHVRNLIYSVLHRT